MQKEVIKELGNCFNLSNEETNFSVDNVGNYQRNEELVQKIYSYFKERGIEHWGVCGDSYFQISFSGFNEAVEAHLKSEFGIELFEYGMC